MLGTRLATRRVRRGAAALSAVVLAVPVAAQSPDVGADVAVLADLGRVFASVCLNSASLGQAQGVLRSLGMLDNPETGTFFHQTFDMSINPANGVCSMVFRVDGPEQAAMDAFSQEVASAGDAKDVDLQVSAFENAGETYLRSGIEVQW